MSKKTQKNDQLSYENLTARNHTYVPENTQKAIRNTRLLIAGVGMGSSIAEAAVRIGFEKITLVDKDTVAPHNLNRQSFTAEDIDAPKVFAIANRLNAINPNLEVRPVNDWLTLSNVKELVTGADIIFDTIDFLSMEAIVALHDECRRQGKPIISLASAGFGAFGIYFPPDSPVTIRKFFELPETGPVGDASYVKHFAQLVRRISGKLDPMLVSAMEKTFVTMADGTPCPAPHLVIGASTMAALGMTIVVRILQGKPVLAAPQVILLNLNELCLAKSFDLGIGLPDRPISKNIASA